jgi:hypothetical protein
VLFVLFICGPSMNAAQIQGWTGTFVLIVLALFDNFNLTPSLMCQALLLH